MWIEKNQIIAVHKNIGCLPKRQAILPELKIFGVILVEIWHDR